MSGGSTAERLQLLFDSKKELDCKLLSISDLEESEVLTKEEAALERKNAREEFEQIKKACLGEKTEFDDSGTGRKSSHSADSPRNEDTADEKGDKGGYNVKINISLSNAWLLICVFVLYLSLTYQSAGDIGRSTAIYESETLSPPFQSVTVMAPDRAIAIADALKETVALPNERRERERKTEMEGATDAASDSSPFQQTVDATGATNLADDDIVDDGDKPAEMLDLDNLIVTLFGNFHNLVFFRNMSTAVRRARRELQKLCLLHIVYLQFVAYETSDMIGVHVQSSKQRDEIWKVVEMGEKYLEGTPEDTSVYLWLVGLYIRLGDLENINRNLRLVLNIMDDVLDATCIPPQLIVADVIGRNPERAILTQAKQEGMKPGQDYDIEFLSRNVNCVTLLTFRSKIAKELAQSYFTEARNSISKVGRRKAFLDGYAVFQDNYEIASKADKWTISGSGSEADSNTIVRNPKSFLRHHMQQFEYIAHTKDFPECQGDEACLEETAEIFLSHSESYRKAIRITEEANYVNGVTEDSLIELAGARNGTDVKQRDIRDMVVLPQEAISQIGSTIFRNVHYSGWEADLATKHSSSVLNTAKDSESSRDRWAAYDQSWAKLKSSVLVIDDVFTDEALEQYRRYTLESTIWHNSKPSGYICSFMDYGFSAPLVAQTVFELRQSLPSVFCDLRLAQSWGYKYPDGNQADGIAAHSDYAAVNVNCWITSDKNVQNNTGGMIIWPVRPPDNWTKSNEYNIGYQFLTRIGEDGRYTQDVDQIHDGKRGRIHFFVEKHMDKKIKVPYKTNRCVIFDSSFVHETDLVRFGDGYKSRRINLTYLFGLPNDSCAKSAAFRQAGQAAAEATRQDKRMRAASAKE